MRLDIDMQLKYVLVMQTERAALQIIRQVDAGNSGYRAVVGRYFLTSPVWALTQLRDMMSFDFGASPAEPSMRPRPASPSPAP